MITDGERPELPVKAVTVSENPYSGERYEVGNDGVMEIKWGTTCGHMAHIQTLQVFKGEVMHSEHIFVNVLGVYYGEAKP